MLRPPRCLNSADKLALMLLIAFLSFAFLIGCAIAQEQNESSIQCPPPQPPANETTCKVLVLTPFEIEALLGERGILNTAQLGRPLDLTGAVTYFRDKIRSAPAGKPFPEKPK